MQNIRERLVREYNVPQATVNNLNDVEVGILIAVNLTKTVTIHPKYLPETLALVSKGLVEINDKPDKLEVNKL